MRETRGQSWTLTEPECSLANARSYILDRIRAEGGVRVADLVRDLGVSDMTVRRDLEHLQDRGCWRRSTAVPHPSPGSPCTSPASRQVLGSSSPEGAIAEAAAELVQPGMAIAISAGTTTHAMAARWSRSRA